MVDVVDRIFKSKFNKAVARSAIITVAFFATVDQFITTMSRSVGLIILAFITFYALFLVFAFHWSDGKYEK